MPKDKIYTTGSPGPGSFRFDDKVADVFPDMLSRSIPGYATTIQAIGSLASRYVVPHSRCYDLGCSLGAATVAMLQSIAVAGVQIIAVDNSSAMIRRCKNVIQTVSSNQCDTALVDGNIQDIGIDNASMIVMNYTLQFLPLAERQAMIEKVAAGMIEGGVFVLSEKVVHDDSRIEETLVALHHDFKRANAYSDLEISNKRNALENVLVPETVDAHTKRLLKAGFRHTAVWLRELNFVSILAIR